MKSKNGPIEHFSWGCFIINGEEHSSDNGVGKNILVHGEKVLKWKKGKGHHLSRSSFDQIKDQEIDILIIGIGVYGAIIVDDDLRRYFMKLGISRVIIDNTPEACDIFNSLLEEDDNLCLVAHGTC